MDKPTYKIEDFIDIEHCVYHALVDPPEELDTHRLAQFISRVTAALVKNGSLSPNQVEEFLATVASEKAAL